MIIEHTIKRPNGSHPKMPDDGTTYHFLPNAVGDHVSEVVNEKHIDWFLSISTFRAYKDQPKLVDEHTQQPQDGAQTEPVLRRDPTNPFAPRPKFGAAAVRGE
jgi:hypothetical protein